MKNLLILIIAGFSVWYFLIRKKTATETAVTTWGGLKSGLIGSSFAGSTASAAKVMPGSSSGSSTSGGSNYAAPASSSSSGTITTGSASASGGDASGGGDPNVAVASFTWNQKSKSAFIANN